MRSSNFEIPAAWARGVKCTSHTGNYWTDGQKLYSYRLCIGDTTEQGVKVLRDYSARGRHGFQSMTTSSHVGRARVHADIVD